MWGQTCRHLLREDRLSPRDPSSQLSVYFWVVYMGAMKLLPWPLKVNPKLISRPTMLQFLPPRNLTMQTLIELVLKQISDSPEYQLIVLLRQIWYPCSTPGTFTNVPRKRTRISYTEPVLGGERSDNHALEQSYLKEKAVQCEWSWNTIEEWSTGRVELDADLRQANRSNGWASNVHRPPCPDGGILQSNFRL